MAVYGGVDPNIRALADQLGALKAQIDTIERGLKTGQLGNTSIDSGALTANDANGTPRAQFGQHPDGTYAASSMNNPNPPPVPSAATLIPTKAGLSVGWGGSAADGGSMPVDFSHVNVYVAGTPGAVATLSQAGSVPVAPLPYTAQTVTLTAVNLSGKESGPSAPASATPTQVVGADLLAKTITAAQLADQAGTAAVVATGAITNTKIADNAISTPKLQAGSVVAGTIAAGSIQTSHLTAGAVTTNELAANSVTSNTIAANSVTAGDIAAGAVTADKLAATLVLAGTVIAGSQTGARVTLSSLGIQAFRANGYTKSLDFNNATGDLLIAGQYRSGDSGQRIIIGTDGTQNFYDGGTNAAQIANNGNYGIAVNSSARVDLRGPVGGFRVDERYASPDGIIRRFVFIQNDSSGNDIGDSVLHYYRRPSGGGAALLAPNNGCGIVLSGGIVNIVTGTDTTYGRLVANGFDTASSVTLKENIGEISVPAQRTSWDIIEGAPSLGWDYISESETSRGDKPRDPNGKPILLRRRRQVNGVDVPGDGRDAFEDVESDFAAPLPPRRRHKFPLAEDLWAMDPELVNGDLSDPSGMSADLRDMAGTLWDAVDMLIKRNRLLEAALAALFPLLNLPGRPQKGDVRTGVGAVVPGRTVRDIDTTTGQIRGRIRATLTGGNQP